jgi:hypothetical protein
VARIGKLWIVFILLAPGALLAGEETYARRPHILRSPDLTALRDVSLTGAERARRDRLYRSMVRFVAQVRGLNSKFHTFWIGRDGEYFYDISQVVNEDDPTERDKNHLMNVSRVIYSDATQAEMLLRYLTEIKLVELLRDQRHVSFGDTGWRGFMISNFAQVLLEIFHENRRQWREMELWVKIHTQFALAANNTLGISSSRAFFYSLDPTGDNHDPKFKHFANRARILQVEYGIPHYTNSAKRLAIDPDTGTVQPFSEESDPAQKAAAITFMRDLKWFLQDRDIREEYARENVWHQSIEEAILAIETAEEIANKHSYQVPTGDTFSNRTFPEISRCFSCNTVARARFRSYPRLRWLLSEVFPVKSRKQFQLRRRISLIGQLGNTPG